MKRYYSLRKENDNVKPTMHRSNLGRILHNRSYYGSIAYRRNAIVICTLRSSDYAIRVMLALCVIMKLCKSNTRMQIALNLPCDLSIQPINIVKSHWKTWAIFEKSTAGDFHYQIECGAIVRPNLRLITESVADSHFS